jgi:WD40 repeat protein
MIERDYKYVAFISYKRKESSTVARWLRRTIRDFRLPAGLRSVYANKPKIYLDTSYQVPTDDFFLDTICPALLESKYLIVLVTPGTLAPPRTSSNDPENWVAREVEFFRRNTPLNRVIFVNVRSREFPGALPADINVDNPRIGQVDLRAARYPWHRLLRTSGIRDGLIGIISRTHEIAQVDMPILAREERNQQIRRAVRLSLSAIAVASAVSIALLAAFDQASTARSRTLAAQSERVLSNDPELALRLAIGAGGLADTLEADGALRQALRMTSSYVTLGARSHRGIEDVAIDAAGRRVAAGYEDGSVRVWDIDWSDNREIVQHTELPGVDNESVHDLVLVGAGHLLLVNLWEIDAQTMRTELWDLADRDNAPKRLLREAGEGIADPSGKRIAVIGGDDFLSVYSAPAWQRRDIASGETLLAATFVPDSGDLVGVTASAIRRVASDASTYSLPFVKAPFERPMIAVDPAGRRIAVASRGEWRWRLWEQRDEGQWRQVLEQANQDSEFAEIDQIGFSDDGTQLAMVSWRRFQVWGLDEQEPTLQVDRRLESGSDEWSSFGFSPGGDGVLVENRRDTVLVLDSRTDLVARRIVAPGMVGGFAIARETGRAAIFSGTEIRVHEQIPRSDFRYLATRPGSPDFGPAGVGLSPCGKHVAIPRADGVIEIRDVASWKSIVPHHVQIHGSAISFSTSGQHLLVPDGNNAIIVYGFPSLVKEASVPLDEPVSRTSFFDLDSQGEKLLIWNEWGSAQVLSVANGNPLWSSHSEIESVYYADLQSAGDFVAAMALIIVPASERVAGL